MVTRTAFTLLEAVLALAILSGALVVCIQVRAQTILGAERLREIQRADRAEEALFQMLVNQTIDEPRVDEDLGVLVWEGEYLDKPYRVERWPESVPNPVAGQIGYRVPARVTIVRYAVEYDGRTFEMVWHR